MNRKKPVPNLIISYLIPVVFSVILVISLLAFSYRQVRDNVLQMQMMTLSQSRRIIDSHISDIRNELQTLFNSSTILEFSSFSSKLSSEDYFKVYKIIQTIKERNMDDNVFIAYKNSGLIVSNRASYSFPAFTQMVLSGSDTSGEDFYEYLFDPSDGWYRLIRDAMYHNEVTNAFVIKQSLGYKQNRPDLVAFYVLDTQEMISMMGMLEDPTKGNVMVMGEDGETIDALFRGAENWRGSDMIFQSVPSSVGRWEYAIVQPKAIVMESVQLSVRFLTGMIGGGLLILCIISLCSLRSNKNVVSGIVDSNRDLTLQLEKQIPYVIHDFYKNLLDGKFDSVSQMDVCSQLVGLDVQRKYFNVLVAEINPKNRTAQDQGFIDNARLRILKIKNSLSSDEAVLYFYEINFNKFAVICGGNDMAAFENRMENMVLETLRRFQDGDEMTVYIGIGNIHSKLIDVSSCYTQAQCALFNISIFTKNNVKYFADLIVDTNGYEFSEQMKTLLANSVCSGDCAAMQETLRKIITTNIVDRSLSEEAVQLFLFEFYGVINRIQNTIAIQDQSLCEDIKRFMSSFNKTESLYKIHDIQSLLQRITSYVAQMKKVFKENLIYQIKDFVDANYTDPNLSLQMLTEKFGISEAYLSQLFKKVLHIKFSQYLEDLRMNQVCTLLRTTKLPVNTIVEQSGYNTINTFGRAFKRRYGVSPTDYRAAAAAAAPGQPLGNLGEGEADDDPDQ